LQRIIQRPARRVTPRRAGALVTSTRLSLVATAEEGRLSFSAANNGQQEKSPSSEAGARLGFDGSNNNGRPLSPQQRDF
jgi:hypothetical protein